MNAITNKLPNVLTATARARASGRIFDYFSIPLLCNELCELLDHAKDNSHARRQREREAVAYDKRQDYYRANQARKLASDDRIHFKTIEERANELPIVREGDSARRKQIIAICQRGYAK